MPDRDTLTVIIDNHEIIAESATLIKTMDTGADACAVVMPWEPGLDPEIDRITKRYSYSPSEIYIGDVLVSEQILYDVTQTTNNSGTTKNLEFWSKTADIIDSTVIAPYEMNNVKLTDRCKQQCNPFGIDVILGDDVLKNLNETRKKIYKVGEKTERIEEFRSGYQNNRYNIIKTPIYKSKYVTDEKKFPRVKAEPTDAIFPHLAKLASQRGLLLSCTDSGDLLITKANVNSKIVGTIEESASFMADEYSAKFSGRDRYAMYRAIIKSSSSRPKGTQTANDLNVPSPRLLTFNADDNIPGEAKSAAEWRKNKSAADSRSINFPVNSWYAPDGSLWKPNTRVTVISKTLETGEKGFTYLITRVEYKFNSSGSNAVLALVPPEMYSDGVITE